MTNSLRLGSFVVLLAAASLINSVALVNSSLGQAAPPARPGAFPPAGGAVPQQGGAPASGVAIIDLNYILKHHAGFTKRREDLQRQAEQLENDFKGKRDAIQKMAMQLEELNRGSPDYKKMEIEITKRQADLSVDVNRARKDFQEAGAKISYEVYKQIGAEVNYYAEQNHIGLVIKFDGDATTANKDNPEEVMREIQNLVMYSHPSVDITPIILERLQQKLGGPAPAAANRQLPPAQPPAAPRR